MFSSIFTARRAPLIALVVAMVLWASSFVALKISFVSLHPAQVLFGRMAIASLCFLLFFRQLGKFRYHKGDWKILLAMALFEPCFYFIFESLALQHTTASEAGVITSLLPLLVALGAWFAFGDRMTRRMWCGFLLAIAGAVGLSLGGESSASAPNPALGNFYEFLAMLCATGYTLLIKHLSTRYSPLFLTAFQSFTGMLFFLPPALWVPGPENVAAAGWAAVVYLGVFVSIGAYGLYNFAISRMPAAQASAYVNLIPVFTVVIAFVVLGERLQLVQWFACGLVIVGLLIARAGERESP